MPRNIIIKLLKTNNKQKNLESYQRKVKHCMHFVDNIEQWQIFDQNPDSSEPKAVGHF